MDEQIEGVEREARQMGWVPADEFKGDQAKWVDADTFVERGHTVMPILRKNNERLEGLVHSQQQELQRMKQMFNASQESIHALQEVHEQATRAAVEKAKRDVMNELKQAKRDGDVDREVELSEELAAIKSQEKDFIEAAKPKNTVSKEQQIIEQHQQRLASDPAFAQWMSENPWFGTDERKTARAMGIAQTLRADDVDNSFVGKAFYDSLDEALGKSPRSTADKVGSSSPSGRSSGDGAPKSFSQLPADAREACDRQGKKLVGEGRAFKDMNAWRTYYTKLYNEGA